MNKELNYSTLLGLTDDLLNAKDDVNIYVGGNSMFPHLRKGDYVRVTKTPLENIKKGDVVVFKGINKYVAHRAIKIVRKADLYYIITKGDSLSKPDKIVTKENYIGKIISYQRKKRIVYLESPFYKKYNFFLASISPYTPIIYRFVRFLKHAFSDNKK